MRISKGWRACVAKHKKSPILFDIFCNETETARMNTMARLESEHDDIGRER